MLYVLLRTLLKQVLTLFIGPFPLKYCQEYEYQSQRYVLYPVADKNLSDNNNSLRTCDWN
jgi:hypothetical protein